MAKYHLFVYETHEVTGGAVDYIKSFKSVEAAERYLRKHEWGDKDAAHITDAKLNIVKSFSRILAPFEKPTEWTERDDD